MTWLVAGAVVMVLVLVGVAPRLIKTRRSRASAPDNDHLGLDEADAAELAELSRRFDAEYAAAGVQVMLNRMGEVVRRNVPVRAVAPGPVKGLARIRFADGTTLQVRGRHAGDLGQLAVTTITQRVLVSAYRPEHNSVVVDLDWRRGRVSVVAVGLDQAD